MGQYMNQPDFITHSVKEVTPVAVGSLTAADSLDSSVIYIGSNTGTQDLEVIPAGAVGPSVVTGFSSPITSESSKGAFYTRNARYEAVGGSGEGIIIKVTEVNDVEFPGSGMGAIKELIIEDFGENYLNGDIVTFSNAPISGGPPFAPSFPASFRVKAEPGLPTQDQAVLFKNPPQGEWFPVPVDYVLSGNTTVTDLIAGK